MNAVWSFWSKPYVETRKSGWYSEKQHRLSWILSFHLARKYFSKTLLVTDDYGADLLTGRLKLEFDRVSTTLNKLDNQDARWWTLGKLYAYASQHKPFIHIDNDGFLWKPLPIDSETKLFAQNPDYFEVGASFYMPEQVETLIQKHGGWLPEEWAWYRSSGLPQRAESCGIFGGTDIKFIKYYAKLAMEMITHPANSTVWNALSENVERNILVEQYLLSACIEYQKNHSNKKFSTIAIEYLFNSMDDAFNPANASEAGYTHLIADSKKDKKIADDLDRRVKKDFPEAYKHVCGR